KSTISSSCYHTMLCLSVSLIFIFTSVPLPPPTTLFPYTTLFRSVHLSHRHVCAGDRQRAHLPPDHAPDRRLRAQPYPGSGPPAGDRKSTRLNSSHVSISYAVFCLKKKI